MYMDDHFLMEIYGCTPPSKVTPCNPDLVVQPTSSWSKPTSSTLISTFIDPRVTPINPLPSSKLTYIDMKHPVKSIICGSCPMEMHGFQVGFGLFRGGSWGLFHTTRRNTSAADLH